MEERRFGKRWPTSLNGIVILSAVAPPIHCTVRDISDEGARILFPHPVELPLKFELAIGKGFFAVARVVWGKGNEYGLVFVARPVTRDQRGDLVKHGVL